MKKDDDRIERRLIWVAKILWHIGIILSGFTAGASFIEGPEQSISRGVLLMGLCLLMTGQYLWFDWLGIFETPRGRGRDK